jgi:3-oxoacyl-[acyl-carrier-protein] synthase II
MNLSRQPGVVITGIGVVSPFGVGRDRFWQHVSRGCSGTRYITQFDVSSYPSQVAAWVPPVSAADAPPLDGDDECGGRADPRRYSRAALFGVIAAREAWRDADLPAGHPGAGVLIGSGGGGIDVGEMQYEDFFTAGGAT